MKSKYIKESDLIELASEYNLELALVKSIIETESSQEPYDSNGYPTVLFEGHWFHRFTKGKYDNTHPHLSHKNWTKVYYRLNQLERVEEASNLDFKAACMSASWGSMQVMGFNYKMVGYNNIEDFLKNIFISEYYHVKAGLEYIKNANLLDELRNKNWEGFSRGYNGPRYRENNYHIKLERNYIKHSR